MEPCCNSHVWGRMGPAALWSSCCLLVFLPQLSWLSGSGPCSCLGLCPKHSSAPARCGLAKTSSRSFSCSMSWGGHRLSSLATMGRISSGVLCYSVCCPCPSSLQEPGHWLCPGASMQTFQCGWKIVRMRVSHSPPKGTLNLPSFSAEGRHVSSHATSCAGSCGRAAPWRPLSWDRWQKEGIFCLIAS